MNHDPILLEIPGLHLSEPGSSLRWEPTMFAHLWLTMVTLLSVVIGLVAQAIPQAPPEVSWTAVFLAAIGAVTLIARLLHSYGMARLQVERTTGENTALKAEVATYRAGRPAHPTVSPN